MLSRVWLFVTPWTAARRTPCSSLFPGAYSDSCPLSQCCDLTIASSATLSPFAFSLSQHQELFHWLSIWCSLPCLLPSTRLWIALGQTIFGTSPVAKWKRICLQYRRGRRRSSISGSGRSPGEGNGKPSLENPTGRGAWRATVHRIEKSQTQLKRQSKWSNAKILLNCATYNISLKVILSTLQSMFIISCLTSM